MSITLILTVVGVINVPFWMYFSTTSPTPPTAKGKRLRNDFTAVMTVPLRLLQLCLWVHAIAESLAILQSAGVVPVSVSVYLLLQEGQYVHVTPLRAVSGLIFVLGGILRWWCFRELGAYFTFHVTLLENHRLITSGPYAYVRHPSYAGALMMHFLWPWLFLPGSWVIESSITESIWFWIVVTPCLLLAVMSVTLFLQRCKKEDEILKKQFGKKWVEWRKDVPYRLFPGLY